MITLPMPVCAQDLKAKVSDFDLATREDELQDCYQARSEQSQHSRCALSVVHVIVFHRDQSPGKTHPWLLPVAMLTGSRAAASISSTWWERLNILRPSF